MNLRGQIGIEFVSVFVIALLIFVLIQVGSMGELNSLNERQSTVHALHIVNEVDTLVASVGYSSDLSAPVFLPAFLAGGYNYSLGISNLTVYIVWTGASGVQSINRPLYVTNVTNASSATNFTLNKGVHIISKISNGVMIT